MSASDLIAPFLATAARRFGDHNSTIARQIAAGLGHARQGPVLAPATMPACHVLPRLLSVSQDQLLQDLAVCADDLHWRMAGFGRLPSEATEKLAVCELIGPNGMFVASDIRIGLLIQTGRFSYPHHWHAAEELYLVMQGTADWAVDDKDPTPRPPGSFVHHKSLQPHRMETRDQPMLALWGWVGDIAGSSYSV